MDRQANYLPRRLPRRTVVKGLLGFTITIGGISCASPNAPPAITATKSTLASPSATPVGSTILIYSAHYQVVNAIAWSPDGIRIGFGQRQPGECRPRVEC